MISFVTPWSVGSRLRRRMDGRVLLKLTECPFCHNWPQTQNPAFFIFNHRVFHKFVTDTGRHFNKTLADAPRSTTTSQKVKYVRIDTVHYLTVWKNSFYLTKKDFDIKKFFESKENL